MADRRLRPRPVRIGAVSVVVTGSGRPALDTLADLVIPGDGHEIVVVTPEPIDARPPGSRTLRTVRCSPGTPVGVARNLGAATARGELLSFVDAGARPDGSWVAAAIARFRRDARVAAVASRVVDERGAVVFSGAGLNFVGETVPLRTPLEHAQPVLFPSEHALVVDARAFAWVGGYDPAGAGCEDVDLGWRLWIAGFQVWFDPVSTVAVAAPSTAGGAWPARLAMLAKNLDDDWAPIVLDTARRVAEHDAVSPADFEAGAAAGKARRAPVQATRRVRDRDLWPRFGDALAPGGADPEALRGAVAATGLGERLLSPARVLIVTPDVLAPQMAGPAIRALELGRALAASCPVEVVSTVQCTLTDSDVPVGHADDGRLREAVSRSDVVVVQGHVLDHHPWLAGVPQAVVVDLYDPIQLEVLEQSREMPLAHRRQTIGFARETITRQLARGDFFLVASEKQRDFWIGHLALAGRVNASTYDGDENLRDLVDVVPFGISGSLPAATRRVLRGVVPGIDDGDLVVLWAGGIYNWFDPVTLIEAMDGVRRQLPTVRLFFMGMQHPHPEVPEMEMARRARAVAEARGLLGTHVFFNEGWVEYDRRHEYLLEANLGVSTHLEHVETAFSFRTRVLDYLWAGLPIVATAGDGMAHLIEREGFGRVVPPGDADALESALVELLSSEAAREECSKRVAGGRDRFLWDRVVAPLERFCAEPRRAPDLVDPRETAWRGDERAAAVWGSGWRQSLRAGLAHVRRGEWDEVRRKLGARVRPGSPGDPAA